MRFHVDNDTGGDIVLWIAPNHPDEVPQVSVWSGNSRLATMEANVTREDVRQLGMHSTGLVGFHITNENVQSVSLISDLSIFYEDRDTQDSVLIYRRSPVPPGEDNRLLVIDTATSYSGKDWSRYLCQYAQDYYNIQGYGLETLLSILGNELAPSLGVVGFPYLARIKSIIASLDYKVIFVFRDPYIDLCRRIEGLISDGAEPTRRNVVEALRRSGENELFEISNPTMRRLLKTPGEQVSDKDISSCLREISQFDLAVTDRSVEVIGGQAMRTFGHPLRPPAVLLSERQKAIYELLPRVGMASDLVSLDCSLYERVSAASSRAYSDWLSMMSKEE